MTNTDRLACSFTLNLTEGTSDKFYFAELNGCTITSRWGRMYSAGQTTTKRWDSPEAAAKEFFRLARDKMRKGYRIKGAGITAPTTERKSHRFIFTREYGSVQRERTEITLEIGARMIDNLTLSEPDEDLLFESMFTDGDAELVSVLARSHPAVGDSDVAGLGAWLSGAKAMGGYALATAS